MESYTSDSSDSDSTAKTLDLSYLQLDSQVMHEHFTCTTSPEHVETLLLHQNRLGYLPDSVAMFSNLATLDVSNCGLSRLPDFLSKLGQLISLSAKNNGLTNDSLPKSLEGLSSLRELNLSGNRLTDFPEQVFDLPGLRYLYLGGNLISEITKDVWKIQRWDNASFFFVSGLSHFSFYAIRLFIVVFLFIFWVMYFGTVTLMVFFFIYNFCIHVCQRSLIVMVNNLIILYKRYLRYFPRVLKQ